MSFLRLGTKSTTTPLVLFNCLEGKSATFYPPDQNQLTMKNFIAFLFVLTFYALSGQNSYLFTERHPNTLPTNINKVSGAAFLSWQPFLNWSHRFDAYAYTSNKYVSVDFVVNGNTLVVYLLDTKCEFYIERTGQQWFNESGNIGTLWMQGAGCRIDIQFDCENQTIKSWSIWIKSIQNSGCPDKLVTWYQPI